MLTFDEITHTYKCEGRVVPSVTQVLREYVKIDIGLGIYISTITGQFVFADVFEAAGAVGTAIHKMILYYIENDLSEEGLSPSLLAVLDRYKEWEQTFKPEYLYIEEPLYSSRYDYAGTPDIVCMIDRCRTIIDIKTGAYGMAGPQLAAYERLDTESNGSHFPRARAVLYLPKDGSTFKWEPQINRRDWKFFEARLFQYIYLTGRKW